MDLIREGVLGKNRNQYAYQYCNRRLVAARGHSGSGGGRQRYLHSLSRAAELHMLLKQARLGSLRNFLRFSISSRCLEAD